MKVDELLKTSMERAETPSNKKFLTSYFSYETIPLIPSSYDEAREIQLQKIEQATSEYLIDSYYNRSNHVRRLKKK